MPVLLALFIFLKNQRPRSSAGLALMAASHSLWSVYDAGTTPSGPQQFAAVSANAALRLFAMTSVYAREKNPTRPLNLEPASRPCLPLSTNERSAGVPSAAFTQPLSSITTLSIGKRLLWKFGVRRGSGPRASAAVVTTRTTVGGGVAGPPPSPPPLPASPPAPPPAPPAPPPGLLDGALAKAANAGSGTALSTGTLTGPSAGGLSSAIG
mmetsp:Transcript_8284/g.19623  ORF Transcript_8284/g.19623 Transcript_8284/m.19623 type:complete len:210 (-) Transcript_8284:97-726(-)